MGAPMLNTRAKLAIAKIIHRMATAVPGVIGHGEIEATRAGLHWSLDLGEGIDFAIWLLGAFERSTVAAYSRLLRPGMTVIDVGANIGAHTLRFAQLVGPTGRVVAVEPTAWAVRKLRKNLSLNRELAARVHVHQTMLLAKPGDRLEDKLHASWPLHGRDVEPDLRAQTKETTGAKAQTLDDLARSENLERIDFIKLDVDGHEGAVLRGGLNVLRQQKPIMVVELSPYQLEMKDDHFEDLLSLFGECNYSLHDLRSGRVLPRDPCMLAKEIPARGSINVVAMAGA